MEDGEQPSLASASNEFPIHIFDLGRVPQVLVSPTIVLLVLRLIKVAWSPQTQARLVSVSYDFSGQVWDVAAGAPLHNFSGHSGWVMCTMWHATMAGMVLTGGRSGLVLLGPNHAGEDLA